MEEQRAARTLAPSQSPVRCSQDIDGVSRHRRERRSDLVSMIGHQMLGTVGPQTRGDGWFGGPSVDDRAVGAPKLFSVDGVDGGAVDRLPQLQRGPQRNVVGRPVGEPGGLDPFAQPLGRRQQLGGVNSTESHGPGEIEGQSSAKLEPELRQIDHRFVPVVAQDWVCGRTARTAWNSSTRFAGSDDTPTAKRACRPASPNAVTSTSDPASMTRV
jgi:hypothetical protein